MSGSIMEPVSVTILGCSSNFDRISDRSLKYFLEKGYRGRLYPVNPQKELPGFAATRTFADIPGPVVSPSSRQRRR